MFPGDLEDHLLLVDPLEARVLSAVDLIDKPRPKSLTIRVPTVISRPRHNSPNTVLTRWRSLLSDIPGNFYAKQDEALYDLSRTTLTSIR